MTIPNFSAVLDPALAATARPGGGRPPAPPARAGQQNFDAVLEREQRKGGGDGSAFVAMSQNPYLKDMLVSNGGPGLHALMSSSFLEGDSTLRELCDTLLALANAPDEPGASPVSRHGLWSGGVPRRLPGGNPTVGKGGGNDIASLCARFESGEGGVAAIGYDEVGGTSYGIYQIASEVGSMDNFLSHLDRQAPDIARRLRAAGPANTGSREGRMPQVWKQIAAEDPKRFGALQRDFIRESHYEPAARAVREQTGLDVNRQIPALQEVLWSTAVQHGSNGAARIFSAAVDRAKARGGDRFEEALIEEVYDRRAGQFGSSTARVRSAVQNRFREEKQLALLLAGVQVT